MAMPVGIMALFVASWAILSDSDFDFSNKFALGSANVPPGLQVLYYPNSTDVTTVVDRTFLNQSESLLAFSSKSLLTEYFLANSEHVWTAILFESLTAESSDFVLRFPAHFLPNDPPFTQFGAEYGFLGFSGLQHALANTITNFFSGGNATQSNSNQTIFWTVYPHTFEELRVKTNRAIFVLPTILGFFLLALSPVIFSFATMIVSEKELLRVRQLLTIHGASQSAYCFASVFSALVWTAMVLICVSPVLIQHIFPSQTTYNELFLIFFELVLALLVITQLLCEFLSSAKLAGLASVAFSLMLSIIPPLFHSLQIPGSVVIAFFVPTVAAHLGFHALIHRGGNTDPFAMEPVDLSVALLLLLANIIFYSMVIIFRARLNSLFSRLWAKLHCVRRREEELHELNELSIESNAESNENVGIKIEGLSMRFATGFGGFETTAVDGLNLTLKRGEITALLGRNGAGKTTTMRILTGVLEASGGSAIFFPEDEKVAHIKNDLSRIRKYLGFCPQHNQLWPELTVRDHFLIYAIVKGVPFQKCLSYCRKMEKKSNLIEKSHCQISELSGGMQRRVSVGIAFIGSSKFVFLDEPTSGLDPHSRRFVWKMIKDFIEENPYSLCVFSSHFLDEVEVLSDRVAIISNGKLLRCGSVLDLKAEHNGCFILTLSKRTPNSPIDPVTQFIVDCKVTAELLTNVAREVSYRLPDAETNALMFLFTCLDEPHTREILDIENYSVSMTSIEDVFISLEHGEQGEKREIEAEAEQQLYTTLSVKGGNCSSFRQLQTLLLKRFRIVTRDRRWLLVQLLVPLLLAIAAVLLFAVTTPGDVEMLSEREPVIDLEVPAPIYYGQLLCSNCENFTSTARLLTSLVTDTKGDVVPFMKFPTEELLVEFLDVESPNSIGALAFAAEDITLYWNVSVPNSLPMLVAALDQALLRKQLSNPLARLTVRSSPIVTAESLINETLGAFMLLAFLTSISFAFLTSGLAVAVVQERETLVKQLQVISGASRLIWWISVFVSDFVAFVLPLVIVLAILLYSTLDISFPLEFFVFLLSCLVCLQLESYAFSQFLTKHAGVQGIIGSYLVAPALMFMIASISVLFSSQDAFLIISHIFYAISALFGLVYGFWITTDFGGIIERIEIDPSTNPWAWGAFGGPLFYFSVHSGVSLLLIFAMEIRVDITRMLCWKSAFSGAYTQVNGEDTLHDEDEDVHRERMRMEQLVQSHDLDRKNVELDAISIHRLRKQYEKCVAVKDLVLGIPSGETFALVGRNGAGKTTTISMLTGETKPTAGDAFINSFSIRSQLSRVRSSIGLCPQFDVLFDHLTAREHLYLYGTLKGVPRGKLDDVVKAFLSLVDLDIYADRWSGLYSGGNKRKLSLAIALIGNPAVVFLDEPSTGMDPISKRFIWGLITRLSAQRAIVLTSHSMLEINAVCSRLGILKNGELYALGTSTHLKNRFPHYQLDIQSNASQEALETFVHGHFPTAKLVYSHERTFKFSFPRFRDNNASEEENTFLFSKAFSVLEKEKHKGKLVQQYTISQTSLEDVFLEINKEEEVESVQLDQ